MKPRARRVTFAAAVVGAGVVGVLVVLNWATLRDHVEAWHFQLTRETETIMPRLRWPRSVEPKPFIAERAWHAFRYYHVWNGEDLTIELFLRAWRYRGYKVIEQRFPRRAYVVIHDETLSRDVIRWGRRL